MGMAVSRSVKMLFANKQMRILMVGLDGAGKTTILNKLKLGQIVITIPTIGFIVETVEYKDVSFTVWDVGAGQDRIRRLRRRYFQNIQGLIFVVDIKDSERIEKAKDELHLLLKEGALRDVPLLVFANKQDISPDTTKEEISNKLALDSLGSRPWNIELTSAKSGDGLFQGLEWLSNISTMNSGAFDQDVLASPVWALARIRTFMRW